MSFSNVWGSKPQLSCKPTFFVQSPSLTSVHRNKLMSFPMLFKIPNGTAKFFPQSYITLQLFEFPLLLCEIDSNVKLRDENKMLAQATFLSKVAHCACGRPIAIMAIFFAGTTQSERNGTATMYLLTFDGGHASLRKSINAA
jgi:hypothetical protein